MNALSRYEKMHGQQNKEPGLPTIFDLFSRPLADFGSFLSPLAGDGTMRVDVRDCGDHYVLKADLPGVKKEDIKLNFEDGVLTINAEHHCNREGKDEAGWLVRERVEGTYQRAFAFEDADAAGIGADFVNGELSVTLPKVHKDSKKTAIAIK